MAWYPKATKKPLPQNSTQPKITPISVVYHTAVSTGSSLYNFFNGRSQGVESHFYVTTSGKVEQYMSTDRRADCQLDGNKYAISIETQDNGASNPNDIIPWTPAQLSALVDLTVWLCRTHGIPARKCERYNGPGLGYHSLFTGRPGWNQHHACPAKNRIAQFPTIVSRVSAALEHGSTPANTEEDLTPAQAKQLTDALAAIQHVSERQEAIYNSLLKGEQTWGARAQQAGVDASNNVEEEAARLQEAIKFVDDKVDALTALVKQMQESK